MKQASDTTHRGFLGRRLLFGATVCLVAFAPIAARANPRELVMAPKTGALANLVQVVSAKGRTAVVSDVAGVLAVAAKPGFSPHVALFPLEADGSLQNRAAPIALELPRPAALAPRKNYPLAMAVHPKLPLLYVWQDLTAAAGDEPSDRLEDDGFCHLLVYSLGSAEPKLMQSAARGDQFARSVVAGAIALDQTAERLFVPNLRRLSDKGVPSPAIGYLRLDADGLVDAEDADGVQMADGGGKKKADEPAGLATAVRKAGREAAQKTQQPLLASRATRAATGASATFAGYPAGLSFFPVSDSVTIVGGPLGPLTWDASNRRVQFSAVTFYPLVGIGYQLRLAGHPSMPVVFVSGIGSPWVYRMEHVDGYLTLLPQRAVLTGATLATPPVVLPKTRQIVCGGANSLHLVSFDEQGMLTTERIDVPLVGASVEALAYSHRHDKLYAAVDKIAVAAAPAAASPAAGGGDAKKP